VKYVLLIAGFLLAASSGVLALARNSGGMMGRGCMQMMQDMHPGVSKQPNEQWRQHR
jgi:ABC-type phosphate/phosphonate transport system permease subunit